MLREHATAGYADPRRGDIQQTIIVERIANIAHTLPCFGIAVKDHTVLKNI